MEYYQELVDLLKEVVKKAPAVRVSHAKAWVLSETEYSRLLEIEHKNKAQGKRTPDSNGVLPLTKEELKELEKIYMVGELLGVQICGNKIELRRFAEFWQSAPNNYKAILYFAELFNLTGGE